MSDIGMDRWPEGNISKSKIDGGSGRGNGLIFRELYLIFRETQIQQPCNVSS